MKYDELFVTGTRLLGIWVLLDVVSPAITVVDIKLGFFVPEHTTTSFYFFHAAAYLAIGCYLLFGARHLLSKVEPRKSPAEADKSSNDPAA